MANTTRRKCRSWTTGELDVLKAHAQLGADALAEILERSITAVRKAAQRNRVSLRRPGSRRGRMLGIPTGDEFRAIRRAALAGVVDAAHLEALVVSDLRDPPPICPACGERRQRVLSTGLCVPCHYERLTDAHNEEMERLAARRELWTARQRLKRMRDTERAGGGSREYPTCERAETTGDTPPTL